MAQAFIEELEIERYGCVRSGSFRLSPLHAFIGPNDSGKSTLLRAVQTMLETLGSSKVAHLDRDSRWSDSRVGLRLAGNQVLVELAGPAAKSRIALATKDRRLGFSRLPNRDDLSWLRERTLGITRHVIKDSMWPEQHGRVPPRTLWAFGPEIGDDALEALPEVTADVHALAAWMAPPRLLRLDPDALRRPSSLIPEGAPLSFTDELGTGLPGVLDGIRDRDDASWAELRKTFLDTFPLVRGLTLRPRSQTSKGVEIELHDGTRVGAEAMSEGMLYFLAILAVRYAENPRVLLIEEPENGLHPARIEEVVRILREVSKTSQVLIATHSPLVVNALQGDEISVVWRDKTRGTQAMLLSETPDYERRSKIYANGELWLSYADGVDESPLRTGKHPDESAA